MYKLKCSSRGFTLIELLIVVAIIAILAAIAVPNFLEAQTRAKVSRVRADVRSVATAIESYRIDNNKYPTAADYPNFAFRGTRMDTTNYHSRIPSWITTPISYLNSLPEDIFIPDKYTGSFDRYVYYNYDEYLAAYGSNNERGRVEQTGGYLFYSMGPDQDGNYDAGPKLGYMGAFSRYDASNGTISLGNIIRTARSPEGEIPFNSLVGSMRGPN